jgi:septal ring factor EnvC (AmiA/AmiB activator)
MSDDHHKTNIPALERHTQTVLVFVLVAILLWVGATVQETSLEVASMRIEIRYLQERVTRPDNKFAEIEKRLDSIERKIAQLNPDQN